MANVSFKKGTEAKLWSSQMSPIEDGAFYLTTDTHRLYIGQQVTEGGRTETKLFPVNEGVTTVADVNALQSIAQDSQINANAGLAGSFYYATNENILCVWNGKKWVQINPDTNTYITDADWNLVLANKSIQLVLSRNDSNNTINAPKINFVGDSVTVAEAQRNNEKEIDVTINPNLGVTWTPENTPAREKLTVGLGNGSFSLIGGSNIALTKSQEGNNVTISAAEMRPTGATISPKANSANGYDVVVNMPNNSTTGATSFNPRVKYGNNEYLYFQTENNDDANGTLDLTDTYYTKTQVNNLITDFNAVEYKGVWPPVNDLDWDSTNPYPITNVKNGSMYLVRLDGAPALSQGGEVPKVGDLIIAQGTELTETTDGVLPGYLPRNGITWVRIPSGDEAQVDTTYSFSMSGESSSVGVNVASTAGGTTNSTEMFKIKAGNKINVTRDSANNSKEIVVSHKPLEQNDFTASTSTYSIAEGKFSVLTGISKDDYGHISGTTTVAMPAPVELDTFSSSVSIENNANNVATISTSLSQKYIVNGTSYGTAKSTTFNIAGQGLDVSTSGSTVTLSLTWGEF